MSSEGRKVLNDCLWSPPNFFPVMSVSLFQALTAVPILFSLPVSKIKPFQIVKALQLGNAPQTTTPCQLYSLSITSQIVFSRNRT